MTHKKTSRSSTPSPLGFSLVEVLIALVIMSVGMLGIMGLYVHSMQAGRTSMFRHNAVTLAGDIADRIRANPFGGTVYQDDAVGADNDCVDGSTDCTAAQMASNDILLWQQQAGATLPSGNVAIVFTAGAVGIPPTYQITVGWNEAGVSPAPSYIIMIPVLEI